MSKSEIKSPEQFLKSKGITPDTKHHSYDYLYKSIIEAMKERDKQAVKVTLDEMLESKSVHESEILKKLGV